MKSAKLINGKVEIIDTQKPCLNGDKGAIIRVLGCGLCGSDLVKIKHSTAETEKNIILGHEVVGIIEEINSDSSDFNIGDTVALGHHYACGICEYCKNGSVSMCKTFKKSNIVPAGFSQYIKVDNNHLKKTVYKMSQDLPDDEKAFLEPLACCIRAIRRAGFDFDNRQKNREHCALVVGLGSIGFLMLKALKNFGVSAYGFDINSQRADFVRSDGFLYDEHKKYDVVFLTAGSSKAINTALNSVIDGGKVVVFSSVENDVSGFSNNEIYYRELSIISSYSPDSSDLKLSAYLLNNKLVKVSNWSTYYSLDNLAQAVDDSFKGRIFKAYIKI